MGTVFELTGPIIRSRLEPDFYKFSMGQLIFRKYRDVETTFTFRNRTATARLGQVIDLGELHEQFAHARSLMFTNSELHYLRGTNACKQRMFDEEYLEFLRGLRLPDFHLDRRGDVLHVEFSGPWSAVTYWETMALSIISETYYRTLLRSVSKFERDAICAQGIRRLHDKIAVLRSKPNLVFSDFGTRRRFSAAWQYYVDETLAQELNGGSAQGQFLGTSNTHAAMTTGVLPIGTAAHELPMILAGVFDAGDSDPEWLRRAQRQVLDDWWDQYGWGLSIFLPDTFGTDFFFTVLTPDDLKQWKGFRWDSGDLFQFADRVVHAYEQAGVPPHEKMIVASDALELSLMLEAQQRLGDRIRMSYGWGTGLTNDLLDNVMIDGRWFGPMSLVIKPTRANGRGLVKLSDNPAKVVGEPQDVERYKRAAGYQERPRTALKY